jgi:CBS domain-containing membrane protein
MRAGEIGERDKPRGLFGVVTISPTETLVAAVAKMRAWDIRHLLVVENDLLVGLLAAEDIVWSGLMGPDLQFNPTTLVEDAMNRDYPIIDEDTPLAEVVEVMQSRNVTAVPIIRDDRPVGILTSSDVVRVLRDILAEEEKNRLRGLTADGRSTLASPFVQKVMKLISDLGI